MWCDDVDSLQGEVACGVMTWIRCRGKSHVV